MTDKAKTLSEVFPGAFQTDGLDELAKKIEVESISLREREQLLKVWVKTDLLIESMDWDALIISIEHFLSADFQVHLLKGDPSQKRIQGFQNLSRESKIDRILIELKKISPAASSLMSDAVFEFNDDQVKVVVPVRVNEVLSKKKGGTEAILKTIYRDLSGEDRLVVAISDKLEKRPGPTGRVSYRNVSEPSQGSNAQAQTAQAQTAQAQNTQSQSALSQSTNFAPDEGEILPWEETAAMAKSYQNTNDPNPYSGYAPSPVAKEGASFAALETGKEETQETAKGEAKEEGSAPSRNKVLCGKPINTKDEIPLSKCDVERRALVTRGIVSSISIREIRNQKGILSLRITDYVHTVAVKAFVVMKSYHEHIETVLSKGQTVIVKGNLLMDSYLQDLVLTANSIVLSAEPLKIDEEKKAAIDAMVYGHPFEGPVMPIRKILTDHFEGKTIIQGDIIKTETKELRNDRTLVTIDITDYTDAISVKAFFDNEDLEKKIGLLKKGKQIKVLGMASFDEKFAHEYQMTADAIAPSDAVLKEVREDTYPEKRVELHAHTKISEMDAVIDPGELVKTAAKWGHKAVAITDHGVVQGFPSAMDAVEGLRKNGSEMKVIYGVEAYLVDDTRKAVYKDHGQDLNTRFAVFDIETTGFDKDNDKILEIGAVMVQNGQIVDRFSHFIDPERPIPENITKLTSITDEDVKGAGTIDQILPEFKAWVKDAVLVAHNAQFDTGFIANKNEKLGLEPMDNTIVDTLEIARGLFELKRYTLDSIARHLNISLENHHRAVDDAEATAHIFRQCLDMMKAQGIGALCDVNSYIHEHTDAKKLRSHHAIILVKNTKGLRNLYELVSLAHLKYFYRQPRIPKTEVEKLREGLILGSACSAGELYEAVLENDRPEEIERIVGFYDYLEIQPLCNNEYLIGNKDHASIQSDEDLKDINRRIVALGKKYNKPVVATCDAHFLNKEDGVFRKILLSAMDYKDVDEQADLYLRTTDEMMQEFAYLGEKDCYDVVIGNTNKVANLIEHYLPVPKGQFSPVIEGAEEELRRVCYEKAESMYGSPLPEIVSERLERELDCIIKYGFSTLYILARRLVLHSVEDGYYVGSRGSVGSSFAATMSGITEINPLKAHYYCKQCHYSDFDPPEAREVAGMSGFDLPDRDCPRCGHKLTKDGQEIPFEVFLGFKGDKEPDIDLNFSGEYQPRAHAFVEEMFGKDHVFRAGTMGGLAEKTAYGMVRHYLEDHHQTPSNAQINFLISGCLNVKRTTGQHPGGQIIVPKGYSVYDFTPVQHPANDMTVSTVTTHYDYNQLHGRLLKLDILGHDDPTMIRMLEDMTNTVATELPVDDPGVMALFLGTESLGVTPEQIDSPVGTYGISEFGTHFVRQMLVDTKPKNFSDLVRISGLSHGTDVWNNNAKDIVAQGIAPISKCICTREDIMIDLIHLGLDKSRAFNIMEIVRKGKKTGGLKPDDIEEMVAHGVEPWYLESCKKIQYLFPKGHAAAYVTMSLRIAYYKVHYKEAYYAAFFTIRADGFDYEKMASGEKRAREEKAAIEAKPMEEQTAKDKEIHTLLELIVEFYARGCKFAPMDLYESDNHKFKIVDGKLLPPFDTISGMGQNAAESIVAARKEGEFVTIADFLSRTKVSRTIVDTMKRLGVFKDLPETDQMSLF